MLEQVGGIAYLSAACRTRCRARRTFPTISNIVREKYLLRKLITTCSGVVGKVYDYEGEVEALLDEVEKEILRVNESRVQSGVIPIKTLVHDAHRDD